jgi:hypothetical protein
MPKSYSHLLVLGLMFFTLPVSLGQETTNLLPKGFLTGRVTSEKGEPLAEVKVEWEAGASGITDSAGRYTLQFQPRITINDAFCCRIRFRLAGFKALTKAVDISTQTLDAILQSGDSKWTPSICKPSAESHGRIGHKMKILIPKGTLIKRNPCDDACTWKIFYGPKKNQEIMGIGSGAMWGAMWAPKKFLISSSVTQERYRLDGYAFDYRGFDKEGRRWRFTGWFNETIEYSNASDRAAKFFDSIIDNMCWDAAALPKDK